LTVEDSERVLEALKAGAGPVTHSRFEVWGADSVKMEPRNHIRGCALSWKEPFLAIR